MKALVLDAEQRTATVQETPKPTPGPNEALIRVEAIALNPVDALYVFNPLGTTGRVVGSDFSGVVSSLGPSIPSSSSSPSPPTTHLRPGDRVAGFVQGASSINPLPGAFASYVVSPTDLLWKVPASLSAEEASTISLCGLTAAQALFTRMRLPAPWDSAPASPLGTVKVYIHGASTSVGQYAAQLLHASARAHGYELTLLGAASSRHHAALEAPPYGYTHLIDSRADTWPTDLAALVAHTGQGGLRYAFDCIAEGNTVAEIAKVMNVDPDAGAVLAVVRSGEGGAWSSSTKEASSDGLEAVEERLPLEPSYGAVWSGLGAEVRYQGMTLPVDAEARAFAGAFYRWLEREAGRQVWPNRVRLMPGGLERVVGEGFVLLGGGGMEERRADGGGYGDGETRAWMRPVSGEKLVYRVD